MMLTMRLSVLTITVLAASGCKSPGGADSAGDTAGSQPLAPVSAEAATDGADMPEAPETPRTAAANDDDDDDATAAPAPSGLEAAKQRCISALQAERPKAALEANVLDGPGKTKIVRARDPKAYPGTGVCALIYDPADDKTYGKRGEHGIASLIQARGWLAGATKLADAELIELVHQARFDGILILKGAAVEPGDNGGLKVLLPQHSMRGQLQRTWVVTIPASGDESVAAQKP